MSGVEVTVKVENVSKIVAKFLKRAGAAREMLRQEMNALGVLLAARVVNNRLQGQSLHQRSGDLVTSIHHEVFETNDSIETTVGTNLPYGRIHEKGFTGVVAVRESVRLIKQAWGKPIAPMTVTVRAHNMNMRMPQRAFLSPELEAFAPTVVKRLQRLGERIAQMDSE